MKKYKAGSYITYEFSGEIRKGLIIKIRKEKVRVRADDGVLETEISTSQILGIAEEDESLRNDNFSLNDYPRWQTERSYWWVNQGISYTLQKNGRFMWSPKFEIDGTENPGYSNMKNVSEGDVVFVNKTGKIVAIGVIVSTAYESKRPAGFDDDELWHSKSGWRVDCEYFELEHKQQKEITRFVDIFKHRESEDKPITVNGDSKHKVYLNKLFIEDGIRIFTRLKVPSLFYKKLNVEIGDREENTANVALSLSGDKLYQQRAREALPILVRQAKAGASILYSDLAEEMGMPNPRNLNYVLGSIGQTMKELSSKWGEEIPPIQCLVVNKNTGLPGEGVGWFLLGTSDFSELTKVEQRKVVDINLGQIYSFRKWGKVLSELNLNEFDLSYDDDELNKSNMYGSSGEGEKHKALKAFVANNPEAISHKSKYIGNEEERLPSGDYLDVSFKDKSTWVGVEVKSSISNKDDIIRGLFQCIKYNSVMEAINSIIDVKKNIRVILVLGGAFPSSLIPLRNTLGVEVIDRVEEEMGN
ncbi:hypothetical protein [Halobacteriovorax sp. YZS-1-1]|uniref:hypothetical protein n=1 Tax=unclassified Halobacteriovorax TaxID=2639665 RepID=UPI003999BCAC